MLHVPGCSRNGASWLETKVRGAEQIGEKIYWGEMRGRGAETQAYGGRSSVEGKEVGGRGRGIGAYYVKYVPIFSITIENIPFSYFGKPCMKTRMNNLIFLSFCHDKIMLVFFIFFLIKYCKNWM